MKQLIISILILVVVSAIEAQDSASQDIAKSSSDDQVPQAAMQAKQSGDTIPVSDEKTRPLTISGYVEGYYSYDFAKPANNSRPSFIYNFNRHNEFNLNLGFIKAAYSTERVRANLAIAAGTYMNANYSAEPGVLKNVFEANAGYKLSRNHNLWFDIGILPSHIGFESAVGKDNWTLTRSLVAENTPYFESGLKLTYGTKNGKLQLAALALNGWQRITRVEENSLMSWGTQLVLKLSDKVTINYSTFIGTDKPDSTRLWRYHNNLYGLVQFSDNVGLIASIDYGLEQKTPGSKTFNQWYSPVLILRVVPITSWAIALRGELFHDRNGVIVTTGSQNGFQVAAASLNLDYLPQSNIVIRLEGRLFNSKDDIFIDGSNSQSQNTAITFSTAVSF